MGSSQNIYNVDQNGFLFGIRYHIDALDAECSCGIEWMKTTISNEADAGRVSAAIDFSPRLLGVSVPYFFVEQTCMADYVHERIDPTSGSLTLCTIKTMVPLSSQQHDGFFVRFLCDHSRFIPLPYCVVALRIRLGHI